MTFDESVERGLSCYGRPGGPPPRRRSTSGCSDMMCGALDCTTCYGPSAADYNEEPGDECSHCGVWYREEELSGLFHDRICYECKEEPVCDTCGGYWCHPAGIACWNPNTGPQPNEPTNTEED